MIALSFVPSVFVEFDSFTSDSELILSISVSSIIEASVLSSVVKVSDSSYFSSFNIMESTA